MSTNEEFINRLNIYLNYKGLNKRKFADMLNKNEKTIGAKLSGARGFDVEEILQIVELFSELSLDWLFRNEGPMIKIEAGSINIDASETKYNNSAPVQIGHGNKNTSGSDEMIKLLSEQVKQQQELINKLMEKL